MLTCPTRFLIRSNPICPPSSQCWVMNKMGVEALSHHLSLGRRGWMMSSSHINNSLIMENNLQSSNLNGSDFLHQMSPSPPSPTTQGQDVTLLPADLHLNKYRPRRNNMWTHKEEPASLSSGQAHLILPSPAKLQVPISWEGLLTWSIVQ